MEESIFNTIKIIYPDKFLVSKYPIYFNVIEKYPHLVNMKDKNHDSLLLHIVKQKELNISVKKGFIKELLLLGANVNVTDKMDNTSLMYTVMKETENMDVMKILLENGAETNCKNLNCTTALEIAIRNNNVSAINELIKFGADVNSCDKYGRTPLFITVARSNKKLEIASILIKNNADINLQANFNTPLTLACKYLIFDVIKLLVENGANLNLCTRNGDPPLKLAVKSIKPCKKDVVKYLIDKGANIYLKDKLGHTPSYYAKDISIRRLFDSKKKIYIDDNCMICCTENVKSFSILIPCGHCVCSDCGHMIEKCPFCSMKCKSIYYLQL